MWTATLTLIAWIGAHFVEISAVAGGFVTVASVIVKITPTQTDDKWFGRVVRVLEALSLARRTPAAVKTKQDAKVVDKLLAQLDAIGAENTVLKDLVVSVDKKWPELDVQAAGPTVDSPEEALRGKTILDERL